jgi:hypothetical protein
LFLSANNKATARTYETVLSALMYILMPETMAGRDHMVWRRPDLSILLTFGLERCWC